LYYIATYDSGHVELYVDVDHKLVHTLCVKYFVTINKHGGSPGLVEIMHRNGSRHSVVTAYLVIQVEAFEVK